VSKRPRIPPCANIPFGNVGRAYIDLVGHTAAYEPPRARLTIRQHMDEALPPLLTALECRALAALLNAAAREMEVS
jgi:hypothetical protein